MVLGAGLGALIFNAFALTLLPLALDAIRKAIDAAPTEKLPRLMLVEYLLQQKDNPAALSNAQTAVSVIPDAPELLDRSTEVGKGSVTGTAP